MQTPYKVLIADATAASRQFAAVVLQGAGFAVTVSETGAQALQLASTTGPDVVVLDAHLPDVDGFEVCERLQAERSTGPVPVLLLAETFAGLDARMQGSRASAFLTKPCEAAELMSAVKNLARLGETEAAVRAQDRLLVLVADLQRAEEALRRRETQLRNLGDNLPDGVIYQVVRRPDGSNYFPYMSSGLERTFGISVLQAMTDASTVYRLVLPEDLARIRAASDESIRTGSPVDVEYRMRTPDGGIRWMNLRGRPSRLPDGSTQWDVVALDVTDRKRAEEATALRSVAELANAAAHEINNPLTIISGQLALIRRGRSIGERVDRAQAAVDRIRDIVNHMTHITRLEASDAWPAELPPMLDIRRSSTDSEDAGADGPG